MVPTATHTMKIPHHIRFSQKHLINSSDSDDEMKKRIYVNRNLH